MKCKVYLSKKNNRGSAIIMALVTMTLLVTLGLALIIVSMGNLKINVSDAANNDAYYSAEAGVNSAIEQLKFEVASYYNSMLKAQGSDYTALYNGFFANINNNAIMHFIEPSVSGTTNVTTFTQGAFDLTQNTCQFLVSCTSTAANDMKYKVNGSLLIKRVNVQGGGSWNVPNSGNALIAGGTLTIGSGCGINLNTVANAEVASANISGQLRFNKGGQKIINPDVGSIINDNLKYPSYTIPAGITEQGNVSYSGAEQYGDIYCTGFYSTTGIHGNIYCRGNVTIAGGNIWGNIICDGTVSFTSCTLTGTILAKNGITTNGGTIHGSLFSPAAITTSSTTFTNGIVYSSTKITVGGSGSTGILYSAAGDIDIVGNPTFNLMIAKKNITLSNTWAALEYSTTKIQSILADPVNSFFTTSSQPTLNENVIIGQDVSPAGSI